MAHQKGKLYDGAKRYRGVIVYIQNITYPEVFYLTFILEYGILLLSYF
jgi:hypothetical protein